LQDMQQRGYTVIMADRVYVLTRGGIEKLEEELDQLSNVRRKEVAQRLKSAIDQGDLKENAGYDEAKREQGFVEGRIKEIEAILRNARVMTRSEPDGVVDVGSTVTMVEKGRDPETYQIVSAVEADPSAGRISYESPLGKALMGHSTGDQVDVATPGGVRHLSVQEIR